MTPNRIAEMLPVSMKERNPPTDSSNPAKHTHIMEYNNELTKLQNKYKERKVLQRAEERGKSDSYILIHSGSKGDGVPGTHDKITFPRPHKIHGISKMKSSPIP